MFQTARLPCFLRKRTIRSITAPVTMLADNGVNFVTVEGDKVPQTWVERRPDRRFLQINSKPLTVPHEVNSWFVAKVL